MLILWIKDLTISDKPRICMGRSGYSSVQEMQDELIRRRPRIPADATGEYITLEAIDKIPNGVIVWKFYYAMGRWCPITQVTLEEA